MMDEVKNAIKKQKNSDSDLKKQLEQTQKQVENYTNDLKRLQAEFENHIKRTEKEKREFCEFASAKLVKKLLPVIDDFENALWQMKEQEINTTVFDGVKMMYNNLMKILKDEGLNEIKAKGLVDPFLHEVMLQRQSKQPEGEILEVVQKGYELKGKVLRPAKVIVSKS